MNNLITQVNIGGAFGSKYGQSLGIKDLVSIILSNAVVFAGIILLFLMIIGGITMMVGAGSGNKDNVAKGKKALTSAIIGFLIIFASYWIIKIAESIFQFKILEP